MTGIFQLTLLNVGLWRVNMIQYWSTGPTHTGQIVIIVLTRGVRLSPLFKKSRENNDNYWDCGSGRDHWWHTCVLFSLQSLDDLLRTTQSAYPDALLRNVSFHSPVDSGNNNNHGTNDSLPHAGPAGPSSNLTYGAPNVNVNANSTAQGNDEQVFLQSAINASYNSKQLFYL